MSIIPRSVFSVCVLACMQVAYAQTFPTKPIHWVSPWAPGGANDILSRLISNEISTTLGQPVIVENKPGASGTIGTASVAKSPPDGYTITLGSTPSYATAPSMYPDLPYNPVRDFAPITLVARVSNLLVVHPSLPVNSVKELIAYAKANPGKLNFTSVGSGSTPHLSAELFKMMAGVDMVNVPYHGGSDMFVALIGGQVQVLFGLIPSTIEFVRAGRLHALAVTSAKRVNVLPDVPSVSEFVPGYEATSWQGLGAPRNTPKEIIDRLNAEIRAALAEPKMQARLADLGGTVFNLSPAEFGTLIADETEKWGKVIRAANIKVE